MKKFLHKVVVFLFILIIYFGVNIFINYFVYVNQHNSINKTSVLIVGDSHPKRSLNPQYFDDAQNISQTAEPYVLTYWKLKTIINYYTPDTLIIGFSPHNISEFNDFKFIDKKWSIEMFRRSYPIQEFRNISKEIPVDYWNYYQILLKNTALYPKINHINFIGNYANTKKSNVHDYESVVKRHFYYEERKLGVSDLAINYLDSIVLLSNQKKINLIMVSSPVHEKYFNRIPVPIVKKYYDLVKKYSAYNIVYDKTTDMYPDSLYFNSDHLNESGARKFTNELIEYLDKNTDYLNRN